MRDRIKEVMKQVFQMDEIHDDISQLNCEKWDSMKHLNLVVELETEFDVDLEPEEIATLKNLEIIEKIMIEKTEV